MSYVVEGIKMAGRLGGWVGGWMGRFYKPKAGFYLRFIVCLDDFSDMVANIL